MDNMLVVNHKTEGKQVVEQLKQFTRRDAVMDALEEVGGMLSDSECKDIMDHWEITWEQQRKHSDLYWTEQMSEQNLILGYNVEVQSWA